MPVGFETYNDDGSVRHSATGRIAKVLGSRTAVTTNGSLTDARFADGVPWVTCITESVSSVGNGCDWSVSGNTLSWNFQTNRYTVLPTTIIYGIY